VAIPKNKRLEIALALEVGTGGSLALVFPVLVFLILEKDFDDKL
jgi:hypothetical protein